ncbi:MAG: ubiquinol-cytochrome c reductase iron-sulfur subunit [Chloroflexota bacterium]
MTSPNGGNEITRRTFLGRIIGIISGVIAAAVATPLVGYFLSPMWKKDTPTLTAIAGVSEIPIGEPTYVTYEERVRQGWYTTTLSKGAWVVNKDGNEFVLFDPRCTHLNCPYYWDKANNRFQCPCHDGRFDINGNVIGGPPPRPLDKIPFHIDNGIIVVGGTTRVGT